MLTKRVHRFDFTSRNRDIAKIDLSDKMAYTHYVSDELAKNNATTGVGGYDEDRLIYKRSNLFGQEEDARSVHLGLDIWSGSNTSVFTPLNAVVHSFKNNHQFGDYGPTIILTHQLDGYEFHTLYGHLSLSSLKGLFEGKQFDKGEQIGFMGTYEENGNWPPHLHFQIIIDMEGFSGDYPGVCKLVDRDHFLKNCPDPHLMLNIIYNS